MSLKREPTTSSWNTAYADIAPGFVGKRYGLCTDGSWHLVLTVHESGTADVQCSADATLVYPQPTDNDLPMCKECVELHFGTKR